MKFLWRSRMWIACILFIGSCSPKIAEMGDKTVTIASFGQLLKESDSKFLGRSDKLIDSEFANWKKLRTLLTQYLDREAIFLELRAKQFELSLKEKQLLYWIVLGEYGSFLGVKEEEGVEENDAESNAESNTESNTESDLEPFLNFLDLELIVQNREKLRGNFLVLAWGKWSFDFLDIQNVLRRSEKEEDWILARRVQEELFPKIRVASQSLKKNVDQSKEFQNWWNLRWKKHWINKYQAKIQKEFREEILSYGDAKLRSFYKEHLSRFVYYNQGESQPYQLSYTRSKEELVQIFLRKKKEEWMRSLWDRYGFRVEESYFEDLGRKEVQGYSEYKGKQ